MVDPVFVDTSEGKTLVADSLNKNKVITDPPITANVEPVVNQVKIEKNKDKPTLIKDEEILLTSKDEKDADDIEVPTNKVEMRGRKYGFSHLIVN